MKNLLLKEILQHVIDGQLVGTPPNNLVITKVGTKPPKKAIRNALFFNLGRRNSWKLEDLGLLNKTNVIITDICIDGLPPNALIIKVGDIKKSYWQFIQYYRRLVNIPIIGVTGTCGKTTTTEMIRTILSAKYKTRSSYDGNNAWYLSLPYLLSIDEHTQAAVFEMGIGAPGHLKYMCRHYKPQIGILLNIGTYHLLGCKTQENYIKAKAELLEGLRYEGTLILNADDVNIKKIDLTPFKGKVIYFGLHNSADFQATDITYVADGMKFLLLHKGQSYPAYVPGYGEHNVYNALAAIAAAHSIGIEITDSLEYLASYRPVRQHMQLHRGINGCTVIDDTWNCTPSSVESGLKVLKDLGGSKRTVAVLGYMPQLGTAGHGEYYKMGQKASEFGIDSLIIIGDEAKKFALGAIKAGFNKDHIHFCTSAKDLHKAVLFLAQKDTVFLFKFPYKYRLSKDPAYREFMQDILGQTESCSK